MSKYALFFGYQLVIMCYHTSHAGSSQDIKEYLQRPFPEEDQHKEFYHANGFAHPIVPVLAKDEIRLLQWGLIPNWRNKTREQMMIHAKATLNARDETIFETPSFKNSINSQRCVIPVTGFFEPHTHEGKKYPFYIAPKEGRFLLLAGIYSHWKDPGTNEWMSTFSIITTDANRPFKKIHNAKDRMAVILTKENAYTWQENDLPKESIKALMQPCPEEIITAYSVSQDLFAKKINSNKPEILEYVQYPELSYDQELFYGFNR